MLPKTGEVHTQQEHQLKVKYQDPFLNDDKLLSGLSIWIIIYAVWRGVCIINCKHHCAII